MMIVEEGGEKAPREYTTSAVSNEEHGESWTEMSKDLHITQHQSNIEEQCQKSSSTAITFILGPVEGIPQVEGL